MRRPRNATGPSAAAARRYGVSAPVPRVALGADLELRGEVVEPQLLQPLAHLVQLGGAVGDQLAALAAELEGLAQAGLAGVEPVDDLLQPLDRGLVGVRLRRRAQVSLGLVHR